MKEISVSVSQQIGTLARDITIDARGIESSLHVDDEIQVMIAGVTEKCFITGIVHEMSQGGWTTMISALTKESYIARKSPLKRQIFMSMTSEEFDDFMDEFDSSRKIEHLDYVPRIKNTADEFGIGGWKSNEIIDELAKLAGISIAVNNCYSYWVKQYTVDTGRPILEAILDIVKIFEPFIYYNADKLFIVDSSTAYDDWAGSWTPSIKKVVRQEIVRKEVPSQLVLNGTMGEFRPDKYRGYCDNTELKEFMFMGYTQLYYGDPIIKEFDDEKAVSPGHNYAIIKTKSFKTTQWYAKDIFGNEAYLIGEVRQTFRPGYWYLSGYGGYFWEPEVHIETSILYNLYDQTSYKYNSPRETARIIEISAPYLSWNSYIKKPVVKTGIIEQQITMYSYYPDGIKKVEASEMWGKVQVRRVGDEYIYIPVRNMRATDFTGTEVERWMRIRNQSQGYTQLECDTYMVHRNQEFLDRDGRYSTQSDTQVIQGGGVQGKETRFRKAQTYAGEGLSKIGDVSDSDAVMLVPSQELSINTPSWNDLDEIFKLIKERMTRKEVIRTFEIPREIYIGVGLGIEFEDVNTPDETEKIMIPGTLVGKPIIIGFQVRKSHEGAMTTITAKGFFN